MCGIHWNLVKVKETLKLVTFNFSISNTTLVKKKNFAGFCLFVVVWCFFFFKQEFINITDVDQKRYLNLKQCEISDSSKSEAIQGLQLGQLNVYPDFTAFISRCKHIQTCLYKEMFPYALGLIKCLSSQISPLSS